MFIFVDVTLEVRSSACNCRISTPAILSDLPSSFPFRVWFSAASMTGLTSQILQARWVRNEYLRTLLTFISFTKSQTKLLWVLFFPALYLSLLCLWITLLLFWSKCLWVLYTLITLASLLGFLWDCLLFLFQAFLNAETLSVVLDLCYI